MALLTRDQILNALDMESQVVAVPEWGGDVMVKGLTGAERDAFERRIVEMRGKKTQVNLTNIRAKLVALCAVDKDGKRIFTDADVVALGGKSAAALDRVFTVAQKLSGLTTEDVDELEKNLESALSEDSTSN